MYIEMRCPVHNKPLYGNGQTSTHNLFKCPDCDYSGGEGAVRIDLPERYKELERVNEKLLRTMRLHVGDCCSLNNEVALFRGHWEDAEERCEELERIIRDIEDWGVVSFDEPLLKLIKALKSGKRRSETNIPPIVLPKEKNENNPNKL